MLDLMLEMLVKFNNLRQVYRLMLRPINIIMNAYSWILVVMEAKRRKIGLLVRLVGYQQRSTRADSRA